MKKITAEVARRDISHLKAFQKQPNIGLSLREETYLQALEIALPILEQQERGEQHGSDWIEWRGHKPPVNYGALVDIKFRDGSMLKGSRSSHILSWVDRGFHSDIIAYRIIPEREESCSN